MKTAEEVYWPMYTESEKTDTVIHCWKTCETIGPIGTR